MSDVLMQENGKPYPNKSQARNAMAQLGLTKTHEAVEIDGGWGITENLSKSDHSPDSPKEKYWKVRFSAKGSPNDTDDVILSVNGETLTIRREKLVIIPDRYRECADHATYLQFTQQPNQPRKVTGKIKVYQYEVLGEASEAEFREQVVSGTKATEEAIRKYGFDHVPDDDEGY